ncbi:sugar transferase, partial [Roseicyclus sp.]|uniref:sugar transferase n=1 Tax=Roseicyclus sp. TaxID=1914329 RepID=UPI001BD0EB46
MHLPVFHERPRLGLGGLSFGMIKFLSFDQHEEARRRATLTLSGRESIFFQLENAWRNTRVGQVLRRWRLHEMPQLLNMLMGDKSLVDL